MDDRHISEILSYLLSLAIFSASFAALYYLLRFVLGFEKSASGCIVIFMVSLCVTDYVNYYRKRRNGHYEGDQTVRSFNRLVRESRMVEWLRKKPSALWFLFAFLWVLLTSLLIGIIGEDLPDVMEDEGVLFMIVVGLVLAPIIETLIFQVAIIEGCKRIAPKVDGRDNVLFAMLVSSLLFGIGHGYSSTYVVYAFFLGLGLSALYVLVSKKLGNSWKNGFWAVVLLHLCINSLAFIGSLAE